MGGMFTTYILLNRPDLFDMVFVGAPGNNERQLMPAAKHYFKNHKEKAIKVDPVIFNRYTGSYISKDTSLPDVLIFTKRDKLYRKWQRANEIPTELIPESKSEFFGDGKRTVAFYI